MIDGTGKLKIPSKFAKRAARYNEFGYKLQKKSEEKPPKVLIVESIEGDDEKEHYANFKHIFIRLTLVP